MINLKCGSKGSTLIILLFTLSVIVLIGTMAMSLSVINYKMKNLNSSVKQTFYLAEAGIDEAYIITKDFVDSAISYAITKVEEFNEIESQINEDLKNIQIFIDNGGIDERQNIIFNRAFKSFIKGACTDISPNNSLVSVLKKNDSYVAYRDGYPKINPKLTEFTDYFLIELKSSYKDGNIENKIILTYKIIIPRYNDYILSNEFKPEDMVKIVEWKMER